MDSINPYESIRVNLIVTISVFSRDSRTEIELQKDLIVRDLTSAIIRQSYFDPSDRTREIINGRLPLASIRNLADCKGQLYVVHVRRTMLISILIDGQPSEPTVHEGDRFIAILHALQATVAQIPWYLTFSGNPITRLDHYLCSMVFPERKFALAASVTVPKSVIVGVIVVRVPFQVLFLDRVTDVPRLRMRQSL
jgi:hypothetical protein